jgi:mannose-6-phosphate isomerase-like protein (cupin superfamily)
MTRVYLNPIQYPYYFYRFSDAHTELAMRVSSMHPLEIKDYGPNPLVINIEKASTQNNTYRTALWTGSHLQVTVMSIGVGDDIGLEVHPTTDQFIRIEEGQGLVQMGDSRDRLDFEKMAFKEDAIIIPAGKWHNLTNTGTKPLKIYVIYAPPQHPAGTVHVTKADAMAAEK